MKPILTIAPGPNKLLIFGGPYSNLEAIQALRQYCEEQQISPNQIICTGDLIAYCADPVETVSYIRDWGIHCIAGNVELNLRDQVEDCGCNFSEGGRCDVFSKNWYAYAQSKVTDDTMEFIQALPEFLRFEYHGRQVFVLHGSYHNTSEFIFKSTDHETKKRNFVDTASDIILAGHCGLPFHQYIEDKIWLNAGVIGMPANDGSSKTWFAEMAIKDQEILIQHQQLEYNHRLTAQKMVDRQLPKTYANSLLTGIWDNCEILPQQETQAQGFPIQF